MFYTMKAAAEYLGLSYQTFYNSVRIYKAIPAPTHKYGNSTRKYYTQSDLDKIKKRHIIIPTTSQKGN